MAEEITKDMRGLSFHAEDEDNGNNSPDIQNQQKENYEHRDSNSESQMAESETVNSEATLIYGQQQMCTAKRNDTCGTETDGSIADNQQQQHSQESKQSVNERKKCCREGLNAILEDDRDLLLSAILEKEFSPAIKKALENKFPNTLEPINTFSIEDIVEILYPVWEELARGFGLTEKLINKIKYSSSSKVTEFFYKKNKQIADLLNTDCLWRELARKVFPEDSDIESLGRHYAGGGNPALMFLQKLLQKFYKITIKNFIETYEAKGIKRDDVKTYFENLKLDSTKQLRDLDWFELERLANKIAGNGPGYNDWKDIANSFGFNQDEISSFETSIRSENSYSPGEKLLQKMRQRKPDMTDRELADYCKKCGLHRIAKIILN